MITKERRDTIRRSQMMKHREYDPGFRVPEGLVYQGSHFSLYCRGGMSVSAKYYITRGLFQYILVGDRIGLNLAQGLALCKAFDLYDTDEVDFLFGPQRSGGYITTYVRDLAKHLIKLQWRSEKEMTREVIRINEQNLKAQP